MYFSPHLTSSCPSLSQKSLEIYVWEMTSLTRSYSEFPVCLKVTFRKLTMQFYRPKATRLF